MKRFMRLPWEQAINWPAGWKLYWPNGEEFCQESGEPFVTKRTVFEIRCEGQRVGELTIWPNRQGDQSLS
jgi:hypothetical protein